MTPARLALLQGAVDDTYGEDILILPMTGPGGDVNARKVADGSRQPVTVTGVWAQPYTEEARRPRMVEVGKDRAISATRPQVKIQAALLPYELRMGDRLKRVSTGVFGEIAANPHPDGTGRIVLVLTALSRR